MPSAGSSRSWFTASFTREGPCKVDNDIVKRLVWSGMLAASGAIASIAATKLAALVFRRVFDEDPPE